MSFFDNLFKKIAGGQSEGEAASPAFPTLTALDREINAVYALLVDLWSTERLVVQAGKMDALQLMRSEEPGDRVLALQRILEQNPLAGPAPKGKDIAKVLASLEERVADMVARKSVEDKIEKKVTEKLEQDHADYVEDIRRQVIKEEKPGIESPHDRAKRE